MEKSPGDEFSFPITKVPQLEKKLFELPMKIYNLRISIINFTKDTIEKNATLEEIYNKILEETNYNCNTFEEEEINKQVKEALLASKKYQLALKQYNASEEKLELTELELEYLRNCFRSYQAASRMV